MEKTTSGNQCTICGKENATIKCSGCSAGFCFRDLLGHRQQLSKELDNVEYQRNLFRQTLTEQRTTPQNHSLVKQINQWEEKSIEIIQQTADEARQVLLKSTSRNINQIEMKLRHFTEEIHHIREENDFNEIHLYQLKKKLQGLEDQLNNPSNITIQEDASTFIRKISIWISTGRFPVNDNTNLFIT